MSYTDEEIDKLFKEAGLNQKTPVFKDSFFDDVEALLPQKRNRKGIFWIFGSILTLIVGVGTFVGLNYSTTKTQIAKSNSNLNTNEIVTKLNSQNNTLTNKTESVSVNSFETTNNTGNENNNTYSNTELNSKFKKKIESSKSTDNQIIKENNLAILEMTTPNQISEDTQKTANNASENENDIELSLASLAQKDYYLNQTLGELLANPFPVKTTRLILTASLASGFSENFLKNEPAIGKPVFVNTIGVNLQYKLKTYTLTAGLQYSNYQTHDLNLNRSSKVYSFEVNKYNQTIDYKWISTLQLPISIAKEFGNHSLAFGIDPSLVLGSCVDFTKKQNDITIEDSRYYSNMIGLKRFYLGAHISYDLKLAKNYSFGIKISNQLINPLDMNKFEGSSNKNPFQAQLTLKKYFKLK